MHTGAILWLTLGERVTPRVHRQMWEKFLAVLLPHSNRNRPLGHGDKAGNEEDRRSRRENLNPHQQKVIDRIRKACDEVETRLNIKGHLIITHAYDTGCDGDTGEDEDNFVRVSQTAAITTAEWQYRTGSIRWFLPMVSTMSDDSLRAVVVHEYVARSQLCYLRVDPAENHQR